MKTRRYELLVTGATPLVMNNNSSLMGESENKGRDKYAWEREHFMEKVYRGASGGLVIPSRAIKKMFIVACGFITDKPKGSAKRSFAPFIQGALIVEDDAALDVSDGKVIPWTAVVNLDPSKGSRAARGPRVRPMVPLPWSAQTTVAVFDDVLTTDVLGKIADAGGMKCGLLDARAIDMGRCEIVLSEVKA